MAEILRETRETPITMPLFARAIQVAWPTVETAVPCTAERAGCLWSQRVVETGTKNCYGWNFGNIKDADGDGFDFQYLRNVWEGASLAEARRLFATKQAVVDPEVTHHRQVGANALAILRTDGTSVVLPILIAITTVQRKEGRVDPDPARQPGTISMVFQPPHPQTRFRWYPNLDIAMTEQIRFIKDRFGAGWDGMLQGNPDSFAKGLKLRNYFTAAVHEYAAILRPNWRAYVASGEHTRAAQALADEGFEPPRVPVEKHDVTTTRGIQRALVALGLDPGPVDGDLGPKTRAAIVAFQKREMLKADGVVGPITRAAMAQALVSR